MTNRAGMPLIKFYEGCKLTAYRCPAGVPTIGYGHTSGVKMGDVCTQAQANAWLQEEYDAFEAGVVKLLRNAPTTAGQLGALTSFAYNLGLSALKGSTLFLKHCLGDYRGAVAEFPRWNKAAGKIQPGLVKRRQAEAALYMAG